MLLCFGVFSVIYGTTLNHTELSCETL